MKRYRLESDSIGEMKVPANAYYGIQALRGSRNFHITGYKWGKTFIKAMATVKKAAAMANYEAGMINLDVRDAICAAVDEIMAGKFRDQFITDVIQGGAGTSVNMNVNEVIANRANELLGGGLGVYDRVNPNDHVNCSQSTNDVVPTAGKLSVQIKIKRLLESLQTLVDTLRAKGNEFDDVLKMGRTHLQDAVPIRLGQEFRAFAEPVERDIRRIRLATEELTYINMGATAVGTGLNADEKYAENVVRILAELSGFPFRRATDLIDGTRNLDSFAWLSAALKTCAVNLSKTANDIRLMASGPKAGIGELILPQQQPGSSIMPGKVNPVIPEVVNQVCFQIFGNDITIAKAAEAGQLELNVFEPVLFFNMFQTIKILKNAVNTFVKNCLKDIRANRENCQYWVDRSVGIITALNPYIGYRNAAEIAKESLRTSVPVKEIVQRKGLLAPTDLEIILNPYEMTKPGISGKDKTMIKVKA
ncbi:MAG: aspartate ammonia-lyase [Fusobacteriaceae bacterium]|nr:aspartate ammonia-lyase [Fusobacteriaceae bacterium]